MHVNWCMKNSMSRVLLVFCDEACLTYGVLTVVILYLLPLVLRLCCMVLHIINAVLQPSKKKKTDFTSFLQFRAHKHSTVAKILRSYETSLLHRGLCCTFSTVVCDVSTLGLCVLAGTCTGAPSQACSRSTGSILSFIDRRECGIQPVVIVKGPACISHGRPGFPVPLVEPRSATFFLLLH